MATNPLNPLNDFTRHVLIEAVDPITGLVGPVIDGSVTGFLAADNSPDAGAADPSWSVDGVYIGGVNGIPAGTWQFAIDAALLTVTKCDAAFTTAIPYFIVERDNAVRAVETLKYVRVRKATVV